MIACTAGALGGDEGSDGEEEECLELHFGGLIKKHKEVRVI